ncbi:MAG: AAA family ATPase [Oscillospiraceae bacterium]|jgi:CO dehydrogenase maturation factor|nr:AAA family ATPase [Oscillospiraceae bacterium]
MAQPIVIAVAGKGGTGKTTICGMIIEQLARAGKKVLAVDADPNSNLNEVLGVDVETTLGEIRETMAGRELSGEAMPAGMTKAEYAEFMMSDALSEGLSYDLLVMGRTQGAGCYCYVNGILTTQIDKYFRSGAYDYLVVDNEAGLEHISRGVLPHMDVLLLVSDSSRRGIQAVGRVKVMAEELKLAPSVMKLIVNRAPNGVPDEGIMEEIKLQGLDLIGVLPQDETVYRYDCDGKPTSKVPDDNPVKVAVREILEQLIIKK